MPGARPLAIDCHCHVIDPVRFPYQPDTPYRPTGQEIAPVGYFTRIMDRHDVRHALVVGTNSAYGQDLSPVLDAIQRGEGRFKGVAVVANDIAAADLARLKAAGMIGVAFNAPFHGTDFYAGTGDLLRALTDLNMFLQIQVREDQLLAFLPLIEQSRVRLFVDHCGRPAPERGLAQPGFQALLDLGRAGRACVKLSGFSQFSRDRYPFRDVWPFVHALTEAFGWDGCVWGSDWPFLRSPERNDYGLLLDLIADLVPEEANRRKLLWDTPARLFGFGG